MTFPSQFSLSLELSRLVPLSIAAVGKTYEAAMQLARNLQSSGSDIVVEEDLAEIFGRSRIMDNVAASFRQSVSVTKPPERLIERISLYSGPGPTVNRALVEMPYFSTVVQCSFLVHSYKVSGLAAAIQQHIDITNEGMPKSDATRAVPALEAIRGTLQAIEDQTSSFDWTTVVLGVAALLDISEASAFEPMPSAVFRGLLSMLPSVQRFPLERLVLIRCHRAACQIVVWAHILLGLTVLVRTHSLGAQPKETSFGTGPEQVVVELGMVESPTDISISLLKATSREELFRLRHELDDDFMDSTRRIPIRGYATRVMETASSAGIINSHAIKEMALITCAFAILVSRSLVRSLVEGLSEDESSARRDDMSHDGDTPARGNSFERESDDEFRYIIPLERIIDAIRLLFDEKKLNVPTAMEYVKLYQGRAFHAIAEAPQAVAVHLESGSEVILWRELNWTARQLSVLVLAVANCAAIDQHPGLRLIHRHHLLVQNALCQSLWGWNGIAALYIREDAWLETLLLLLIGDQTESMDTKGLCLASHGGHSIFVSTMSNTDPAFTEPGGIAVKKGVPWREGVWKHRVIDSVSYGYNEIDVIEHACSEDVVTLTSSVNAELGKPMIGENGDSFVLGIRINVASRLPSNTTNVASVVERVGYNEMWSALWAARVSNPCNHKWKIGDSLTQQPGWNAVSKDGGAFSHLNDHGRFVFCLTAGDGVARWQCLISILRWHMTDINKVFIRSRDCCLECLVKQALATPGRYFLVL